MPLGTGLTNAKAGASRRRPATARVIAALLVSAAAVSLFGVYLWLEAGPYASVAGANLLVLGTDVNVWGRGQVAEGHSRSDTIVVIGVRNRGRSVSAVSVPRDTLVPIEGHGVDRINAAHAFGGVPLTRSTLSGFLGVPIHGYVKTNYQGFTAAVDVLGGVEVDVERDLFYQDRSQGLTIDLKKGKQRLNGAQALQYARFRNDRLGDIGRVGRQQRVLKALVRELLKPKNITKWPEMWRTVRQHTETDMTARELVRFCWALRRLRPDRLQMRTLPGHFYGVYWQADPSGVKETVRECLALP